MTFSGFPEQKVVTLINVRQPERTVESQFNENRFLFQPVKTFLQLYISNVVLGQRGQEEKLKTAAFSWE